MTTLPFPGGPYKSNPLGGVRIPVKSSGWTIGRTTLSLKARLTSSRPTIESNVTPVLADKISRWMVSTSAGSQAFIHCFRDSEIGGKEDDEVAVFEFPVKDETVDED